jgi:NADH-quinone oxidoreductase subunit N
LFLLSLAGIPPTAGFIAKVLVFQAAVDAGLVWLVVLAVVASVIAAFFYIRILVLMYMEEPEEAEAVPAGAGPAWALAVTGAVTLALGIVPSLVLGSIGDAAILRW